MPACEVPKMGTQTEVDLVRNEVVNFLGFDLPIVNDLPPGLFQLSRSEDSVIIVGTGSSGGVWAATLDDKKVVVKYFNCIQTEDDSLSLRLQETIQEARMTSRAADCGIAPQFHGLMVFNKTSALKTGKLHIALVL